MGVVEPRVEPKFIVRERFASTLVSFSTAEYTLRWGRGGGIANADNKMLQTRAKHIEQMMQRTMATVALTHMHCGSSKLPLKGFQSLRASSSALRFIFPSKNGMQPSGTRCVHSSCSMYTHSMR
jgi:hypothetical protein